MSKLLIVESPAKAKTIKKYLGRGYEVVASMGHVRDLPKSKLGIDVENNFEPKYIDIRGKGPLIKELKSAAAKSQQVYLATDPDREGEAISWHLANMLGLDMSQPVRVTFNEITKNGVKSGMNAPRTIDISLVNAQQARRILDRLVGYKLSPFLWKKVRMGLSAGRVQSVAVRIIVEREEEIRAFVPEEYWTVDASLFVDGVPKPFLARFYGDKSGKLELKNQQQADQVLGAVTGSPFSVTGVKKGQRQKSPSPPFTTSTLQQDASRRLGFQATRTMRIAQDLYEGVTIKGMGAVGLITYMRTDSLRIADQARDEAAQFISETYGKNYLPEKPRVFKSRSAAQDAHEAIRPTMPALTPKQAQESLTPDQYKMYKLIWERFTASQMANAVYNTVSADIESGGYVFKASGRTVAFDGFTALYSDDADGDEAESLLPELTPGDPLKLEKLLPQQHFTTPPPRFTEASLIKTLEENGIGRPSTYAPTISTIIDREYIERQQKSLAPTPLGEVVTNLMKERFPAIVDVDFTAGMENNLDQVEEGKKDWVTTLREFYSDFEKALQAAEEEMGSERVKVPDEETDEVCELCGRKMVIKSGRFGKFLACPGYPECKNTRPITKQTDGECPLCGGKILQKKSKNKNKYFGCEHNPNCSFMTWDTPLKDRCPKCGKTLFKKNGRGAKIYCAAEGCGYEQPLKSKKGKQEGEE